MDLLFWYKLGLSFLIGGIWVTISTLAAEKFGSIIGGILAGFPSTVAVALFFIGFTQSEMVASEATTVVPMTHGVNGIFLLIFILLINKGLIPALSASFFVWFSNAFILSSIGIQNFGISLFVWFLFFITCFLLIEKVIKINKQGKLTLHYSKWQIVFRALFGGGVIAFAVLIGKLSGPTLGGIFATFPAMFVSTLVVTHLSGGAQFSRAVAKSMLFSGLINVTFYVIVIRYLYLWIGLVWGTLIALVIALFIGYITFYVMKTKLS